MDRAPVAAARSRLHLTRGCIYEEILYPIANRLLARCDAVLRLLGLSKGADEDVRLARKRELPVYFKLADVPGCG